MNANDRYEARAARFYKETGMMAPGKDEPPPDSVRTRGKSAWKHGIHGSAT